MLTGPSLNGMHAVIRRDSQRIVLKNERGEEIVTTPDELSQHRMDHTHAMF